MLRRNYSNNYHAGHKAYMVTLHIQDMVPLLSKVEESANPDEVAHCHLTALGEAMRQAWLTLPQRFPNISIKDSPDEYVIMPEHFHGIIYVTGYMQEHLSEVIRLFKARVAMSYRQLLTQGADAGSGGAGSVSSGSASGSGSSGGAAGSGSTCSSVTILPVGTAKEWLKAYQALPAPQQEDARRWIADQLTLLYSATRCGTQTQTAAPSQTQTTAPSPIRVTPSGRHVKTGFLFGTGYTDSLLLSDENLDGHRLYILNNPRSRWMRSHNRQLLRANRNGIDTAVSIPALEGYLGRVCPRQDVSEDKLAAIRSLLLLDTATGRNIVCQTYGDRALLNARLLPVVCHRKDAAIFQRQKARCLQEAANGAVLVSACISPKEREIIRAAMDAGYPVARILDNGFPEIYHPSQDDIGLCATSKLLLLSPWQYHYRHKDEAIYVAYCKTMNCIAQAICRQKDEWWKVFPDANTPI